MSWASTALRAKLRELQAAPPGGPVPSPCISICRMDPRTDRCEGCRRTLDEIAGWSSMDDDGKRQVWRRVEQRLKEQA